MGSVDDLTFKVNFSADGVAQLRERVKDKLKEFMGDYTDDTLVEYVIVLLRNGRRKEEARNELNVFLGDDSTSFVSWLWEHLASNLKLYVQDEKSCADGATKLKPISDDQVRTYDSSHLDSESEKGKANQSSRTRHNREWKGMVRDAAEPPPLRSSVVDNMHFVEKRYRDRKSRSPGRHTIPKKRSRPDEGQHTKREVDQATIAAPRRLLQFAVRDAVGTSKPYVPDREPSLKRLRSVVSTSTGDSAVLERPQRIKSVATVPNPLATVIKAVAEAAEDVTRVKSGGSVFDRLGRGTDEPELANRPAIFREADVEEEDYGIFDEMQGQTDSVHYDRRGFDQSYIGDMEMLETEAGLAVYSMSDEEQYNDVDVMGHSDTDAPRSASSRGNKIEDHLMMQNNVAKNFNDISQLTRNKAEDQRVAAVNVSHKMVHIPLNVNTWKSPNYQEKRVVAESEGRIANQENESRSGKAGVQSMKENSHPVAVSNGNVKPAGGAKRESQIVSASGSYNAGRPSDDADSRTIFVSNVHFAATKDAISRHFNKFGEVLKVVIVTDAATGQPTGSAYVEFMRKEAADSALSLDGTSFMSRILKVVKRSSAQQDAAPVVTWPRVARGSPYTAARFSRAPFPRGIPGGAFRPRLPIKPGARSLQWKREAQSTPPESGAINTIISPTARSLTYVRTEPKSDGNSGTS